MWDGKRHLFKLCGIMDCWKSRNVFLQGTWHTHGIKQYVNGSVTGNVPAEYSLGWVGAWVGGTLWVGEWVLRQAGGQTHDEKIC